MADVVQYRLESMVDELDELENRGLFTRREIAEIVKKRRQFEYRLKRPRPLKQDILSYLKYETKVESLRKLRKKAILASSESDSASERRSKKWKNSISDSAYARRVINIYRFAVTRFKHDMDLWFQYLEFCRNRRHGRMKKALAQVLRFHPMVPGLWIYAATWEFDNNLDDVAARVFLETGLRFCPESEDLWAEYLRMEFTYFEKLKLRKVAIEEDQKTILSNGDDEERKEKTADSFVPIGLTDLHEGLRKQAAVFFRNIYNRAVDAIPKSLNLRKRFFEVLDEVDLPSLEEMKEEIMNNIRKDFVNCEDYWDWCARLKIHGWGKSKEMTDSITFDQVKEASKVYDEALDVVPSSKMFSLYARFWLDLIDPEVGALRNSVYNDNPNCGKEFISHLFKVYEKAESKGCLTEELAHQYISFYLRLGQIEEARTLSEKLCNGKLSGAENLWILRASVEMKVASIKSTSMTKNDLKLLFEILRQALSKVAISDAESLWFMAIKFFANSEEYLKKLIQNFMIFLARSGKDDDGSSVAFAIVNFVFQRHGIHQAREMYNRIVALPHPSLATYRHCIELELNLAMAGEHKGLTNARKLFDAALSIYKENEILWQDYYNMEKKVGTSDTANAVYWRLQKAVRGVKFE